MTELATAPETGTGDLPVDLPRRLVAEALGTGLLTVAVIGSGIMASRLSPDDVGLQLLENAAATAGALIGLILIFGAVSGAHFNPVVTLVDRGFGATTSRETVLYIVAQIIGGCLGAILANVMFELPAVEWSTKPRSSGALWLSEVVATVGLLLVIHGCVRSGRKDVVAFAVGLWIGAAYWFTSSTSFANPAVTIARTDVEHVRRDQTILGTDVHHHAMIGAVIAFALVRYLYLYRHRAGTSTPTRETQPTKELPMPNLESLSLDQQLALRSAAKTLHSEFDDFFSTETIELFLQTSFDQFADRSTVKNFVPLLAERFARQRLRALAKVEGHSADGTPVVLFLCVHNAGRSQMALGWFNHLAGDRAVAWSGGSEPGSEINPSAVAAMAEVGIDITDEYPKPWTEEIVQAADVVITMGCGDACPLYPGKRYEDWELDDPAGQTVEAVRPIRDEIRTRVERLLSEGLVSIAE